MERACDGFVLLVGDGDFSFSLSLMKHGAISPTQLLTSNLETSETIQLHKLAKSNMSELENLGALVLLEVDACELHTHPTISQRVFSRIIFNFPLADRHNIKKNRALLADFFSSCSQILAPGGQVMVTLCKGQGGTPADQPQRSWHDSWQALAVAANAGFVLADIFPFEAAHFPEYHSVGFRFQDKSFDTGGSLVHVFEKTDIVSVTENIVTRGTLQLAGATYSCSQYIAEKLKRNLLEEESSPVSWLKREMEQILRRCFSSTPLPCNEADVVLPGHKSYVSVGVNRDECHGGADDLGTQPMSTGPGGDEEDSLTDRKRLKDEDNLLRKKEMTASLFAHGVDSGEAGRHQIPNSSKPLLTKAIEFIPSNSESVYVLIKSQHRNLEDGAGGPERNNTGINNDFSNGDRSDAECATGSDQVMDCSDQVFHLRTSLLENLANVCSAFDTAEKTVNHPSEESEPKDIAVPSVTVTGQCCSPQAIQPHTLPVHHDLLFVHKLVDCHVESDQGANSNADFESVSGRLISCLQNSIVFRESSQLETHPCQNYSTVLIKGMGEAKVVKLICRRAHQDSVFQPIGIILKATRGDNHQFFVSILHLDSVICHTKNIPDPRLLWSGSEKVLCQLTKFASTSFSPSLKLPASDETSSSSQTSLSKLQNLYRAVSLYPMKFAHDLSFWETGEPFDESELLEVIRYTANDSVVKVSLVDRYTEPDSGRSSRCYRLHFQSHSLAFPYAASWKLQSLIRIEVARRLGVVLR